MKLILLLLLTYSSFAFAEGDSPSIPNVELEWEGVSGAAYYELEFKLKDSEDKPKVYRSKDTHFNRSMKSGDYHFRIRSVTKDSGPGEWSEAVVLPVLPVQVQLQKPENKSLLTVSDSKKMPVDFNWKPSLNAKKYILKVWSNTSKKQYKKTTKNTSHSLSLKAGREYFWEVQAIGPNGVQYEGSIQRFSFRILGEQLSIPELVKTPTIQSKHIEWKKVPYATSYNFKLWRKDIGGKDWAPVQSDELFKKEKIKLKKNLKPGLYKVELLAQSKVRLHSDTLVKEFFIKPEFQGLSNLPKESTEEISSESQYRKDQF